MKKNYIFAILALAAAMTACKAPAITEDDVFVDSKDTARILAEANPQGYRIYHLNDFVDEFMTEVGSYSNDSTPYRTRSKTPSGYMLFSIDTIKNDTIGIYICGRISTDDYGGNFYKSLVIQEVVDGEQQNLRISVDMGSASGMYQMGQEVLIRCNGLCIGRYANQPQLCVPSYNNNIFANNFNEKVGWAPGRIPSAVFRRNTTLVGKPDQSKLKYDPVTLADLFIPGDDTKEFYAKAAKLDGKLVIVKDVWFTGQYENNGSFEDLKASDPEEDTNANVFGPTTNNIGYPQSRVIEDATGKKLLVSNSEYAKFAHFYLPGANANGVSECVNWVGSITGILGWYLDNAKYADQQDGYEWSITPRGIIGFGVDDICMKHKTTGEAWVPVEYKKAE